MFGDDLGRTLGLGFISGINLYATVAILGLASRFHWVDLPPQYGVFDNNWIIGGALILYVIEFFADKIPWVDSAWDLVHTIIRPAGGAFIALTSAAQAGPGAQTAAALIGAALASSSHFAKAGTRVAVNASPEPLSNWALSLSEDGFVAALAFLALAHPTIAAVVVVIGLILIALSAVWLLRAMRRFLGGFSVNAPTRG